MSQVPPADPSSAQPSTRAAARDPAAGEPVPALKICAVSKRFGTVQANDNVSFSVAPGSIHAIVGENGAGKTTIMRVTYGLYQPDSGHIELGGQPVSISNPREALARGIGMVHQHSLLVDSLTVTENVLLATRGLGRLPRQDTIAKLRRISETNHLHLDPTELVGKLSVGQRQRAEILGALFHGARILILDEPTTVLTPQEVAQLFAVLRRLRDGGTTIMLVTHKLGEVMEVSDHVTVLRAGKVVGSVATRDTDDRTLVRMMVGRDIPLRVSTPGAVRTEAGGDPIFRVQELSVHDVHGVQRLRGVSFDVHSGEIVAITGVEGNGQLELAAVLVGLLPISSGEISLDGRSLTRWSIGRRRRAGLAYIPESRMTEGIDALVSVRDNLILGRHRQHPYAKFGLRNLRATSRYARKLIADFTVLAPSADSPAAILSGGNLQKVVVAREVGREPRLLIAAQPTQGVDVAATHLIRTTLLDLRQRGMAIILVSSDLSEVCDLADRALVFYNGAIFGELGRHELTEEAIGAYAMGLTA